MTQFIQLHLLTSYPPSNLNRDDLGRPKSAQIGGVGRLRVSSQSLKRAWRTSEVFQSALAGHLGKRTKTLGESLYRQLVDAGVVDKQATEWVGKIIKVFGTPEKETPLRTGQLFHISPEELQGVQSLVGQMAERKEGPSDDELKLLRKDHKAVDIGMFGRMLAGTPSHNVEAAVQVAHAFTVHRAQVEDDYFTAVDDLNTGDVDRGAGHLGEAGFGAGVFYLYICISRDQLLENLQGDEVLLKKAISALVEAAATVSPTGKQNSFASRTHALYCMAERGAIQPRSLALAYTHPVSGGDVQAGAVAELEGMVERMDQVYGSRAEARCSFNVLTGHGSLQELLAFVTA